MAANTAPITQLLLAVLRVQSIAERICDCTLMLIPQPVELGQASDMQRFLAWTDTLIPLGLQSRALQRRWSVIHFADHMRQARGMLDTPISCMIQVENMEVVHTVNVSPSPGLSLPQWVAQDYGLDRQVVTNIRQTLPALQSSLLHQFDFTTNDLRIWMWLPTSNYGSLARYLTQWIGDARLQADPNVPFEIKVCVTDRLRSRVTTGEERDVKDVHSDAAIASEILFNLGKVFCIR